MLDIQKKIKAIKESYIYSDYEKEKEIELLMKLQKDYTKQDKKDFAKLNEKEDRRNLLKIVVAGILAGMLIIIEIILLKRSLFK